MNDEKILEFKPKQDTSKVFECGCGSQSFFLVYGGPIQCRGCEEIKALRWISQRKDGTDGNER
jgi:hypothetical protein